VYHLTTAPGLNSAKKVNGFNCTSFLVSLIIVFYGFRSPANEPLCSAGHLGFAIRMTRCCDIESGSGLRSNVARTSSGIAGGSIGKQTQFGYCRFRT